ncbi:polysaccharide deacetylase family protein [Natronorubrum halophilum]|uniref:polysaccharide deacetylase family protein n=1 Tax=Natronorubrum halophilum TaxID=1702106 RepID=UPI000EF6A9D3|nr:polysaccharide deacetylase [Natronorubrum halophilum]
MSRSTVCITCDFDAVSAWLHLFDAGESPTKLSRGLFGVDHGTPRLLDLFDRHDIETTWFVPGHTIESFPDVCETVWSRGHEVQHHGWTHRPLSSYETEAEERADIERGIESIEALTGRRPVGFRSPSWDFSPRTLSILRDLEFEWDSSQMGSDFLPYRLHDDWEAPLDGPFDRGVPTEIVELPVSWQRDDFPPFAYRRGQGFVTERSVFDQWQTQFEWMHEHVDDGVFVLTIHPQVSGQSHRLANLERLLESMRARSDVEFRTLSSVVDAFVDR